MVQSEMNTLDEKQLKKKNKMDTLNIDLIHQSKSPKKGSSVAILRHEMELVRRRREMMNKYYKEEKKNRIIKRMEDREMEKNDRYQYYGISPGRNNQNAIGLSGNFSLENSLNKGSLLSPTNSLSARKVKLPTYARGAPKPKDQVIKNGSNLFLDNSEIKKSKPNIFQGGSGKDFSDLKGYGNAPSRIYPGGIKASPSIPQNLFTSPQNKPAPILPAIQNQTVKVKTLELNTKACSRVPTLVNSPMTTEEAAGLKLPKIVSYSHRDMP